MVRTARLASLALTFLSLAACGADPVAGPDNPDPTAAEATARAAQARDAATAAGASSPDVPAAPSTTGPEGATPAKQPVTVGQIVFPTTMRGQWAPTRAACTDPEGTRRMEIGRSDIHFHESRVTPRAIRDAGNGRFDMDVTKEGEGMVAQTQVSVILAPDTDSLTYRADGRSFRYFRCN